MKTKTIISSPLVIVLIVFFLFTIIITLTLFFDIFIINIDCLREVAQEYCKENGMNFGYNSLVNSNYFECLDNQRQEILIKFTEEEFNKCHPNISSFWIWLKNWGTILE